jgi:indolepyruvate ferredoxin oxidoreductase alpha subunit
MIDDLHPGEHYLLMGNEAIARGALEAGVAVATGYPGTPSSEIIETLGTASRNTGMYVEWSVNEKVALEVAAAASFSGLRSLCAMKQNGVNVASDFLLHLVYSGTGGGCVLVTCDDPGAFSSMNEEDSRLFAELLEIPLLEPGTFQQAKDMTAWAFELSETIGNVVMMRSVTRLSHASGNVQISDIPQASPPREAIRQCKESRICAPVVETHRRVQETLRKVQSLFEESPFNTYEGPDGPEVLIITSGICGLYCREAVHELQVTDRVGILTLATTWPLPEKVVKNHLSSVETVLFVEEILPFLEKNVRVLSTDLKKDIQFHGKLTGTIPSIGELTPESVISALSSILEISDTTVLPQQESPPIPHRDLTFCAGCPHRASFWSIHAALTLDGHEGFVCGDIGCYTMDIFSQFPSLKTIHSMGSGFGLASGFGQLHRFGLNQPVIAVCGDSTFFHAAIPALINAVHHQSWVLFIILDNMGTAMTGFQPHPGLPINASGEEKPAVNIEEVCQGIGAKVSVGDPFDLEKTQHTLMKLLKDTHDVNVLILRRECALQVKEKENTVYVDTRICIGEECGCNRFCTRIFSCPGLIWDVEKKKARIDDAICNGCGVCLHICPVGAIKKREE